MRRLDSAELGETFSSTPTAKTELVDRRESMLFGFPGCHLSNRTLAWPDTGFTGL